MVEDPPGAGLGGVLAGLDGLRGDGAAAERHQLRPLAVDQADERGRRVPGRAAGGRSAPRPPALGDVAGLVEPPADRPAAAVEHQQLGPPVAVEVGDVGAEPAALPRLPVGDRRPRLPRLAELPADAVAPAVGAGHDDDQLGGPVAVEVGERDVAAAGARVGDLLPRGPAAGDGAVCVEAAADAVVGALLDGEDDQVTAGDGDPRVGDLAEAPVRDVHPLAPAAAHGSRRVERPAHAVTVAGQHHDVRPPVAAQVGDGDPGALRRLPPRDAQAQPPASTAS